ncbi:MAG: gliding motility-associated C-terminal domain-containing protein, partial [Bacteroidia bacterium]|nr:gliding motility-associated C-terminal domain-containing protein [Bacteroidia bacterium]
SNYEPPLQVNACQQFIICISNFSGVNTLVSFQSIGTASLLCNPNCNPNYTICAGSQATITPVNFNGLLNPTYSIQPGGQTNTTGSFVVSPSVTTSYTTYITGVNPQTNAVQTTTGVSTVSVFPAPTASPQLVNSTCANPSNSVNLNININPPGNYTLNWNPPPQNYNPVNSMTATGLQPGPNSVTVTTSGGCKSVINFTVGPIQAPASFTVFNPANNYTITCNNPQVVMNTSVTNGVPLSYTWTGCSGTLTGSSATFTAPCVGNVIGTSSTGCTASQTFQIFQNFTAPSVSVNPTVVTVNCSTTSAVTFTGTTSQSVNVTTQWYFNQGGNLVPVGQSQGSINIYYPGSPGQYVFTATNNLTGCSSSFTVQANTSIGMPQFTVVSPTNFTIGCASTSVTSMQITTVVTSPTNNVGVLYALSPPGSTSAPVFGSTNNFTNLTVPGTYTVWVQDITNQCIGSQQISIIQNTIAPVINHIQTNSLLTCFSPSMVLTGVSTNTNAQITWTIPGATGASVWPQPSYTVYINSSVSNATSQITSAGIFTVGALDPNNMCRSTKTVQILQDIRLPVVNLTVSPQRLTCKDPDIVLSNASNAHTLNAALVTTYCWLQPISNPTQICTSILNTSIPGVHTCIATSQINGCSVVRTYTVVQDITPPTLDPKQAFILECNNNPTVQILPSIISPTSGMTYSWIPPYGATVTPNLTSSVITTNYPGLYRFIVTNTVNGCISQITYTVVNGTITANFTPEPPEGFAPLQVNFINNSSTSLGNLNIQSTWYYGNGTSASYTQTQNGSAVYNAPGIYTVVLVVKKGACIDTVVKTIKVDMPSQLEVPNIFSPNKDGVNDVFRLVATNLSEVNVVIFDRWGNKVYETESKSGNFAWDGKNLQGKDCAAGVYFYVIKAKGKDDKPFEKKGNVTLVR